MTKYWNETLAVTRRILTELWHRKRSLIFWAIFPISVMILNGLILAERSRLPQGEAFAKAAPATLVGAALFFSCLGGSVATVVSEREQRTLKRLFLSPLSGISYFLGIFLAHIWIGLGQALVVYGVAALAGAQFSGNFGLGVMILLLSIAAYVGVGFVLGTQFARRTEDVNSLVAAFGVPLLILGGVFLPTSLFPDSLLRLAEYNPVYHMKEALTGVWADGAAFADIQFNFWFLTVFAIATVLGGWLSYWQMVRSERRL
jgi:ABC-2 type transport system permease protein